MAERLYHIADDLGGSVAGLGWLGLLEEREAPDSGNFGLLRAGGAPKPSFFARWNTRTVRLRTPSQDRSAARTRSREGRSPNAIRT